MKLLITALALLSTTTQSAYHSKPSLESNLETCATSEQAATITDFFPDKATLDYAQTFDIAYYGTYKVVTNNVANEHYLLYQCGTEPPQEEIDSGKYRVVASIPLKDGVALTSTVQIPMLELLGLRSEIKTYISDPQYISSPCLMERINDGTLEVVDRDDVTRSPSDWSKDFQNEHPDRIIIDDDFMTSVEQITDRVMLESSYKEGLSKAIFEWIFFYAALYNKEKSANDIANESEGRYDCTRLNAVNYAVKNDIPKSTAVWAYFSDYPGFDGWISGTCEPTYNYYCEYADNCNIELLTISDIMTDEQFEEFAKDVDIFFYNSDNWGSVYKEKKDMLDRFKSVNDKQVFDNQRSGENIWFEQRLAEYDVVMEDVCTVNSMVTDVNSHVRLYMRNVFFEQVGEKAPAQTCADQDAPLVSRASNCTYLP